MRDLRVRLCEWRWIGEVVVGAILPSLLNGGLRKAATSLWSRFVYRLAGWVAGWMAALVGGWVSLLLNREGLI